MKFSVYEGFSNASKQYWLSPSGEQEHENLICIYDDSIFFSKSNIAGVDEVKYIISYDEKVEEDEFYN